MINSNNGIIDSIVNFLEDRGGSAPAVQIVSEVMGLANCTPAMAHDILTGLPDDRRLSLDRSGLLKLQQKNGDDPLLNDLVYVVVDLEATSLPGTKNRMMEFAAVLVENGELVGDYNTLINPETRIPHYVRRMTGITNDMVKKAPTFERLAGEIRDVLADRVIVAHNASFDFGLLNQEFQRTRNQSLDNWSLCTVKLSRKLQPGLDKYRLGHVAEYYGIEIEDRHRAWADAAATAKILIKLLERAEERGLERWSDLARLAGSPKPKSDS